MRHTETAAPAHAQPMAGGQPIGEAVADQAAEWLMLLMSGEATEADRQRWQQWRAEHADHERAWQHIENVTGRLKGLAPHAAYQVLTPYGAAAQAPRGPGRRKAIHTLLWAGTACAGGLLAWRTPAVRHMAAALAASYRTGTGEQRTVTLTDGSAITLNTASAIDVRFDGQRRLLRLVAGEVLVTTGHAAHGGGADTRPFVVETGEGRIRALGTRFAMRQHEGSTQVAVLENAVEITPGAAAGPPRLLRAGEQATFTRTAIGAPQAASGQAEAWSRGQLVADEMRLDDFLAELGRYRPGLVRCAPEVAGLRLSGVFPLHDTGRILATLPSVLPVQVRLRTAYWVTVEAAP